MCGKEKACVQRITIDDQNEVFFLCAGARAWNSLDRFAICKNKNKFYIMFNVCTKGKEYMVLVRLCEGSEINGW